MSEQLFRSKESIEGRNKIAAVIAGFKGSIEYFSQAEQDLQKAGYDVVVYDYPDSVLSDGIPERPLELFDQMAAHFNAIADDYETRLYSGVSMGGAFGIHMQRQTAGNIEPGIYGGAFGNLSWSIFNQPVFLPIKHSFQRNGYSEEYLKKAWMPFYEPVDTAFVVALGTRDYFVRYKTATEMYKSWGGATIRILPKRMGHTKIIKWFSQHIPELLEAQQKLK